MTPREVVRGLGRCECPEPYPQLVEDGAVWICGVCGEITTDPRINLQAEDMIARIGARLEAKIGEHGDRKAGVDASVPSDAMTPKQVMHFFGRGHHWVRDHREELGVYYPEGEKKRARMMFHRAAVVAFKERSEGRATP